MNLGHSNPSRETTIGDALTHLMTYRTYLLSVTLCLCASALIETGCNPGGDFPTAPVSGRVLCDGQPVPFVMVFFEPMQTGKSALVGRQGLATADDKGSFVLRTCGTNDGAVVGHHRVRVGPPHPEDHPNYKCACVLNSEVDVMEVDVKKGKNQFDIVLKKKTGREPPPPKNN